MTGVAQPLVKAAIYSRFSTDKQHDRSIDDQEAECAKYAARNGFEIVGRYHDKAMSGASFLGRTGLQALLADAGRGKFQIVIAESMSRIGRDEEYRANIRKHFTFHRITMMTPSDGVVTALVDQVRGIVDSQYLVDLRTAVRRGNAGVARDGRYPGGKPYGYRIVPGVRKGVLEIYEPEAEIVRRIFREYAARRSPRAIAGELNRDGIPAPRGKRWNASTINGNAQRHYGLLLNPRYDGRELYNRTQHIRDPNRREVPGKRVPRVSRANPVTEWQYTEVEHLRIVDKATWAAVQQRKHRNANAPRHMARRPKHLLSGLLRCGICGSGMAVRARHQGQGKVRCSRSVESQTCDNGRNYPLKEIERIVIAGMADQLRDPALIELYVRSFNEERQRVAAEANSSRIFLEKRLAALEAKRQRVVDLVVKAVLAEDDAKAQLLAISSERQGIDAELGSLGEPVKVVTLHPSAVDDYLRIVNRLAEYLGAAAEDADYEEVVGEFRSLVERVIIHPKAVPAFEVEVKGTLASMIGGEPFPEACTAGRISGSGGRT